LLNSLLPWPSRTSHSFKVKSAHHMSRNGMNALRLYHLELLPKTLQSQTGTRSFCLISRDLPIFISKSYPVKVHQSICGSEQCQLNIRVFGHIVPTSFSKTILICKSALLNTPIPLSTHGDCIPVSRQVPSVLRFRLGQLENSLPMRKALQLSKKIGGFGEEILRVFK
jgi:hypothetical protein